MCSRECAVQPEVPELYFCADLKGYAWCFRKGEYLNVGLGREESHLLAEHVGRFAAFLKHSGRVPHDLPARFHGHTYLLWPRSPRRLVDDGVLLVGDAAGLAYPQSGEGIRPAVESALLAAEVIAGADRDYSAGSLAGYEEALQRRFGRRGAGRSGADWLPEPFRRRVARRQLENRRFVRHVVGDRWFLHKEQPPISLVPMGAS